MNYYLYTDTSRDTTLSKGMFQSNLGLEPRAMHWQYIRWCRTQLGCQKVDRRGNARDELWTCEMESANHLGYRLSEA